MIRSTIIAVLILMTSAVHSMEPQKFFGIWSDHRNIIGVSPYVEHSQSVQAWFVWFKTGITGDYWFNGEFFYAPRVNAYCASVFEGNILIPSVIKYHKSIGEICIDVIEEKLIIGLAINHIAFGCLNMSNIFEPASPTPILQSKFVQYCSGSIVMEKNK